MDDEKEPELLLLRPLDFKDLEECTELSFDNALLSSAATRACASSGECNSNAAYALLAISLAVGLGSFNPLVIPALIFFVLCSQFVGLQTSKHMHRHIKDFSRTTFERDLLNDTNKAIDFLL